MNNIKKLYRLLQSNNNNRDEASKKEVCYSITRYIKNKFIYSDKREKNKLRIRTISVNKQKKTAISYLVRGIFCFFAETIHTEII